MSPVVTQRALSEKEEAFAQLIVRGWSQTRAYREVYASPEALDKTCATEGWNLTRRPVIRDRIQQLTDEARTAATDITKLDVARLLKLYYELAMADPNQLIGLRVGCCRHCYGVDHKYQWREHEYLDELTKWEYLPASVKLQTPVPDIGGGLDYNHTLEPAPHCPQCKGDGVERVVPRDTTQLTEGARLLYQGVKRTRNGVEIILADRTKMLENMGRILGAFKDTVNVNASVAGALATVAQAAADPAAARAAYLQMLEAPANV